MKHRKKRMVLAVVVLVAAVFAGLYWRHTQTPEYKARKLVAEWRSLDKEPGAVTRWLIDLGVMKEPRDYDEIEDDLVALGLSAVPSLIQALKDRDRQMRCRAVWALGAIGPSAKEAVPALLNAFKDDYCGVRSSAVYALAEIVPEAKETVSVLTKALTDEDRYVRDSGALALGRIGPRAKEAMPALIHALKDKAPSVRQLTAWALGKIGPAAKAAVPALTEALKDEDADVRQAVAEALKQISKEAEQKTLHHSGDEDSVSPSELIAN